MIGASINSLGNSSAVAPTANSSPRSVYQVVRSCPTINSVMNPPSAKMPTETSLFQVYLRLRPVLQSQISEAGQTEPWLVVEPPASTTTPLDERPKLSAPSHVVLQPPNDSRKRAVEKFGFTKVFREEATQLDVFESIGMVQLVKNVLSGGRDGLVATLGVTGSGKVRNRHRFLRIRLTEPRAIPSLDLVRNEALHK